MNKTRFLAVIPALFCVSCFKPTTKSNPEEYLDLLKQCRDESDFHTELYIFPDTTKNTEIKSFYYSHTQDLFTGSFLLYLVLDYQETGFEAELERLSSVKATYKGGEEKHAISYPDQHLFLTIKQEARFEYAVYDKEKCEIAYVSNQIYNWDKIPVDSKYVIPDLIIPEELDDKNNTYNIYYLYDGDVGLYIED